MNRIAPRGLSLAWVVLVSVLALDCSHAIGADGPAPTPADLTSQIKIVGVKLEGGLVTVGPDPIVLKMNQDLLVFVSKEGPLSVQFKDDGNPFPEQPECRGRSCIFRVPADKAGTFHYTVMVRGRAKDPKVVIEP